MLKIDGNMLRTSYEKIAYAPPILILFRTFLSTHRCFAIYGRGNERFSVILAFVRILCYGPDSKKLKLLRLFSFDAATFCLLIDILARVAEEMSVLTKNDREKLKKRDLTCKTTRYDDAAIEKNSQRGRLGGG